MNPWILAFICSIPVFWLVSPAAYFLTADAESGASCGALAAIATIWVLYEKFSKSQSGGASNSSKGMVRKRRYNMDLAATAQQIQISMAGAWMGRANWMLDPASNLAAGYLRYVINWEETLTGDSVIKPVMKMGTMDIYFKDITDGAGDARTEVLIMFADTSFLDRRQFETNVSRTVGRLDFTIADHEKVPVYEPELKEFDIPDYAKMDTGI
jgi:hypothetical protein